MRLNQTYENDNISTTEVVMESLRIMRTHGDLQQKRIAELNDSIEVGMKQLQSGQKIEGKINLQKMKAKIDLIAFGNE
ncbi:MAG: hypothetical protein COY58_08555 [Gammaproteobacteria bacterium CG_4_10_14_0_8_um_filter_38_16]|nr:MAG: hypothetical protein COY58_08555 [Gammaproteobacteria bacterium CG_4_10_14_0_8_um_filter_38_16]PJA03320.1 MAG: hypothetical protein COX72_05840 [Gammaproteobacteria bacterium CG_4_10_14_0_2_um_filter_38_22]PJB09631.1 MAG: hypothetical protein CO120_09015 [Gammaproteobacteria bacterium CG_4_9_14_3_um_filter_38_9]